MTSLRHKPRSRVAQASLLELVGLTDIAEPDCEPKPDLTPLAVCEVGTLPPHLLADLPAPTTIVCVSRATGARWYVTTSPTRYAALRESGAAVLTGRELGALAIGAENGRSSHEALAGWLEAKRADGSTRLDASAALGAVMASEVEVPDERWPLARVALHWGFQVVEVEVEP